LKTLDRYIVRQFIMNFIILSVVMMGLYVLVDLIVDLDEFLKAGRENADHRGGVFLGTLWVLWDFYGPFLLLVYVSMSGLIVVAAMGFTISQMQRSRELTAILAGGISLYRVAAPILVAGFIFNLLTMPVQELLIPQFAQKIVRAKSQAGMDTIPDKPIFYVRDQAGALFSAASFHAPSSHDDAGELVDLRIVELDELGQQIALVQAKRARWDDSAGQWLLEEGVRFDAFSQTPDAASMGRETCLTYQTQLSPKVLIVQQASLYLRLQSMRQLEAMRNNNALSLQTRSQVTQIIWSRFSTVILSVLILLMGMPHFLTRVPGNPLAKSARAAGITVGAWAIGLILLQSGSLNPVTAAWLPVVLYLPLSFWMVTTIKT